MDDDTGKQFPGWTEDEILKFADTGERPSRVTQAAGAPVASVRAPKVIPLDYSTMPYAELEKAMAMADKEHKLALDAIPRTEGIEPPAGKYEALRPINRKREEIGNAMREWAERGMSAGDRFLAGVSGTVREPLMGLKEKFELAFPGTGTSKEQEIARLANERAARRENLRALTNTTAGQFGAFVGEVLPGMAVKSSPLAQAMLYGTKGALAGGPDRPKGFMDEMTSSAVRGGTEGALTGVLTKVAQGVGKVGAAATGRYTPKGQRAMALDRAAQDFGLPPLSVGQLDPTSTAHARETGTPAYSDMIGKQAQAYSKAIDDTVQVPVAQGLGTEAVVEPAGKLMGGMKQAADNVMGQANAKYDLVEKFRTENNLPALQPTFAHNVLKSIHAKLTPNGKAPEYNVAFRELDNMDENAFAWYKQRVDSGMTPQAAVAQGVDIPTFHKMRVAARRAKNKIDSKIVKTDEDGVAAKELKDLIKALDNDMDRWASTNMQTKEAGDLYSNAKDFYSKVAAPKVLDNKFAQKLQGRDRADRFENPQAFLRDVLNIDNIALIDRLRATMPTDTERALRVLQDVPDLGDAVLRRHGPDVSKKGTFAGVMPVIQAASHPLLAAAGRTKPAKALYFADGYFDTGPLSLLKTPTVQYLEDDISSGVQNRLGMR